MWCAAYWIELMPKAPKVFRQKERRREREESRGNCVQRGYDWEWMKISKLYRQSHAVCEICNDAVAVDVDHIIPFRGVGDPLRTDWHNLQAVCRSCHRRKTDLQ